MTGTFPAMRLTSALKFRMHPASISMCGLMPLLATWPALRIYCSKNPTLNFEEFWKEGSAIPSCIISSAKTSSISMPVLARHAGRSRLPQALRYFCARLSHRERPEDVQVTRHLHQGAQLSGQPEPGVSALLLCRQSCLAQSKISI
jgi:hypothetical protein